MQHVGGTQEKIVDRIWDKLFYHTDLLGSDMSNFTSQNNFNLAKLNTIYFACRTTAHKI